jgi:hypothetical protein
MGCGKTRLTQDTSGWIVIQQFAELRLLVITSSTPNFETSAT